MTEIPLLGDTANMYITHFFLKVLKTGSTHQFWFLFDEQEDGMGHYHCISNIQGFMGVKYFCKNCLGGFNHKKKHDTHQCEKHPDCKGCCKQEV